MNLAGKFVVIDGPDGCGKGTQLDRLHAAVERLGGTCVRAKDPGGTPIGERIRHVLLGYDLSEMDPRCETLLFMASRAQLVAEVIRPALGRGATVLCDRFISATCAYQVAAGFPRNDVLTLGTLAVGQTWPDLTLVLDVPVEVGFARTGRKPHMVGKRARAAPGNAHGQLELASFAGASPDAMEQRPLDFHRRVRELFLELPRYYPSPVRVIDADRPPEQVHADVLEALRDALG